MTAKNDTPVLLLSLILTLGLLGGGAWWLFQQVRGGSLPVGQSRGSGSSGGLSFPGLTHSADLSQRMSAGERLLVADGASADKQTGIAAIAAGNFDGAIAALDASLAANRNDPEALIYLNNARIGQRPAYTIAIAVPVATALNPALELLRGAAQAQDEVNRAGGINGTPLKIRLVSDDNDPALAAQVAETLVNDATVLGVVGHFGSDASLAAATIYQQGKLPMITPTSTSVQLSGVGDYVFRTVPSDRFTANTLASYMLSTLGQQNAALYFNSESSYSQSLKDELTTALYGEGGQVVAEFDLASPAFDPAASVQQATQQGATVLILAANTATLDPALQVVAVNRGQLPLLGGDSLYNPRLLQVGGEMALNMVVAVPWILLANPQSPFAQSSRQYWGGDVNWRTAMTYDAVLALVEGLRQAPSREGIEQTLRSPNFSLTGATGTLRFLPSGDRNQAMQLVQVAPGRRSGYGYDFVPVN